MKPQYLGQFSPNLCKDDAIAPQNSAAQRIGYLFLTGCSKLASGYRTVTALPIRGSGADAFACDLRPFDRRHRCPRASKSFFPWAWWPSLPLVRSKRKKLYLSIPSRSRSSRYTPASTSKIPTGRALAPVPADPSVFCAAQREACAC